MKVRRFSQVDVFTAEPYLGNPVAVVLDGSGLDDAAMQRFAQWTHLSETTFVLPPTEAGADYRLRIFTPGGELPFAGHPTLGTCHAWLAAGGRPQSAQRIVQQCAQGLIRIRRDDARLAFAAPPSRRTSPDPALLARVAGALGLAPARIVAAQLLDNGPVWLGLLLADDVAVLALEPDHRALREIGQKVGVAGLPPAPAMNLIARSNREARAFGAGNGASRSSAAAANDGSGACVENAPALEVRAFAAPVGIEEDPVTGSLQASLAQWLIEDGRLPASYVAAQGRALGRAGRVHVQRDADGQVWIGGASVSCIDGTVVL